jgi:hypothetical protein
LAYRWLSRQPVSFRAGNQRHFLRELPSAWCEWYFLGQSPSPYTYQYNLSIQHEIAKNLVVEVTYVGSESKGLTTLEDINPFVLGTSNRVLNINQPSPTIQGICQNFDGGGSTASNCPFTNLPAFANVGFANYNSLEASLTPQLYDNPQFGDAYFTLGYTYGRAIDNSSGFQNRTSQVPF